MSKAAAEKWRGRIPDTYYIQLLHYFAITEAKFADLRALIKFLSHSEIRDYHIEREEVENDIEYLITAEKEFAESIRADKCPDLIINI